MIILDLFCGAGGAGVGYNRAGFDVVGVDIEPQPRYPFELIQEDAFEFIERGGWKGFDAIHASPPCQRWSSLTRGFNRIEDYPDVIAYVRHLLVQTGLPYVIENVPAAPLDNPVTLCGEMYGLDVIRHRIFETNWNLQQPRHIPHRGPVAGWRHGKMYEGPYLAVYGHGGGKGTIEAWREAMDVYWMETRPEISQAIPPAYTQYIGSELLKVLLGGDVDAFDGPSRSAEKYCQSCGRRTRASMAHSRPA
ncbi:MAG: DNA cytosine methyltransferase [Fluviibacter sp.]